MLALAAAVFSLLQSPSFEEIADKLRKSADKDSYEAGAVDAAKALAEMRSVEAMELRLELFDARMDSYRGVNLRDWFYSGMLKANTRAEGDLMAEAAADGKRSLFLRTLCLRALEASQAPVEGGLLFDRRFLRSEGELLRAWQGAAGKVLSDARMEFARDPEKRAIEARALLLDAGAPGLGFQHLLDWSAEEIAMLSKAAASAKDPADRAQTLRVLASHKEGIASFRSAAATAVRGKDRAPMVAALEAAALFDHYELVPELINLMERSVKDEELVRFVHDSGNSLRRLTGLPFGPKPEMWRGWWAKEGEAWLSERRSRSLGPNENLGIVRDNQSDTVSARFYGLPVDSARVAIVVDGSGSMSTSKLGELSTVESAAREVSSFCERLPDKAVFQVWIIEAAPFAAFKKAMPVNRSNREKAMDFLRNRSYRSTSSVVEALEAAMSDPDIDTVVLVGDGGSSSGAHQFDGHLLDAAKRLYARHGVRIHTVLVTDSTRHEKLMKDLAEVTGGTMVKPSGSSG
ncbi:MAG: hypothetical protein O3A20_00015 [Planctomycetota bacterium]|nr:hypothetical protein [Planctomycetota bacterium]